MMPNNEAVKSTAKAHLKHLWPECIAVCAIMGLVALLSTCIQSVLSLFVSNLVATVFGIAYFVFITSPMLMGVIFWLWRVTVLKDSSLSEIFFPFSTRFTYIRTLNFVFTVVVRLVGVVILFMLPYALIKLISAPELYEFFGSQIPAWTANFLIFENFLKVIGISASLFFASRYYLAPLLFVVGGDITPGEAIYMSHRIGKVSFGAFLQLILGFIGWAFLSLLIIPMLYTLPYFIVSITVHCRYAINFYNNKFNDKGTTYTPPAEDFGANIKD